ncbi:DNA mismatch repair endonuclease MutL [Sanyastnella coralliicola]|uniref:DNA mismatch repair endonuclease MutL n=1 Tax=Sanyastnella coralliicola TaxID=3069118 RepID=UPI0027B87D51|nr:DNA mismatch repair endonuclease MutL [Longitalea sp. SCSIO 12813]
MSDIIQLLPDFVANQIAAGEVIQRPASVVKELLENAIDAGAGKIQLIIKDAGRTLIQVTDDGCGMSPADARLCFERHATSKIADSQDLFKIRTKGFRGEALASIASVAQVEMKTRQHDQDLGTKVRIEGADVSECEPCQATEGTSFMVRNLFYNVPARRQFLKSDQVETRHIMDEFQRVALAHPDVAMSMHHNGTEVYHLTTGTPRQRVVGLFGNKYDERIIPVSEATDVVSINGFAGKPEFSRKTRGEQFLFVNNRFIKHHRFHHAVVSAMEGLIPHGNHPMYVIYLDIDPSYVDVNIHPTKTEVKFRDEQAIYLILRSAIKKSLGQFQVAPTLDFEAESSLNIPPLDKNRPIAVPQINVDPEYNPFRNDQKRSVPGMAGRKSTFDRQASKEWKEFYQILKQDREEEPAQLSTGLEDTSHKPEVGASVFQVGRNYIVAPIKSGLMVIDQQQAHQRILYEEFMNQDGQHQQHAQQLLYPQNLQLSPGDHALIVSHLEDLKGMGFDVEEFGANDLIVRGLPADSRQQDAGQLVDLIVNALKEGGEHERPGQHALAMGLARGASIRSGQVLQLAEMRELIDRLFACEVPYYGPTGRQAIVTFTPDDLSSKFE